MKKLIIAIAALLLSTPAWSGGLLKGDSSPTGYDRGSAKSWTGAYIGAWGSCGTGSGELNFSEHDTVIPGDPAELNPGHNFNVDGVAFRGCGVAGQVGADLQVSDRFVVGLGFDYEMSNASGEITYDGTQVAEWTRGNLWTIYGRAGVLMAPDSLLYALGGYGQLDGGELTILDAGSMDLPSRDVLTVGVGFEQRFADGRASVKIEYRHREYSDELLHAWEDGSRLSGGASEDAGLVGVTWRFK
jgi:hypothetical protein